MLLVLLALCLLPFLPVQFSLRLQRTHHTQGSLGIQAGMLRLRFPFRISQTPRGGHQLTFLPRRTHEKPRPASSGQVQRGMTALGTFLRADKARRFLIRYLYLVDFTAVMHPALSDAAHNALLTGFLRALTAFIPRSMWGRVHVSVQPDFYSGRSTGYLRCIISLRLGILLITGGMVLSAYLRERKEHPPVSKEA